MKYFIVSNTHHLAVEKDVNDAIGHGYIPFGGLQVTQMPPNREHVVAIFVQAMLKIDANEHWPL